jgi:hypothetical protein
MKQLVYIPYDKSYKITYGISGSTNTEKVFINEIRSEAGGIVTPSLNSQGAALGFPDEYVETTKTILENLATSKNHTLIVYEDGKSPVTVNTAENIAAEILTFEVTEQVGETVIDSDAATVDFDVVYGETVTALEPVITVSVDAEIDPASEEATDFTNPVEYTVTSEHGEEKVWTVTANELPNTATDILTFSFAEQTGAATIDDEAHTVDIEVANGTVVTALVATFTLNPQATAKILTVSQVSGVTANNFSSPKVYIVKAGDGITTQNWTVTVTVEAPI